MPISASPRGRRIVRISPHLLACLIRGDIDRCPTDAPADLEVLGIDYRPHQTFIEVVCASAEWSVQPEGEMMLIVNIYPLSDLPPG